MQRDYVLCPIAWPINGLILNPVPYPQGHAARFYLLNKIFYIWKKLIKLMTQALCNSSNTLLLMNLTKKFVWLGCFSEMSAFQPSVRFSVNDMFNSQLLTCLIFLIMFHSGCLHMQLGEKSMSQRSLISKVFHHQDLSEEYKWKALFTQTWCSLISLCFFFPEGEQLSIS